MQDMENMARQCPDPDNPVVEEFTYWFLHNATRFYAIYDPLGIPPTLASLLSGLVLLLDGLSSFVLLSGVYTGYPDIHTDITY